MNLLALLLSAKSYIVQQKLVRIQIYQDILALSKKSHDSLFRRKSVILVGKKVDGI